MKKIILFTSIFTASISSISAQGGVGVNNTGANPNANAMLDVASEDKGVLIPRLTTTARTTLGTAMGLPENGMLVYDKDLLVFYYWDGTQWVLVGNGTGSDNQNLTGATLTGTSLQIDIEDGTSTTVDLAPLQDGTGTDNQDLTLTGDVLSLTNDGTTVDLSTLKDHDWYEVGGTTQADAITDNIFTQGNVGIGIPSPTQRLEVSSTINNIAKFNSTNVRSFISLDNNNTNAESAAYRYNLNGTAIGQVRMNYGDTSITFTTGGITTGDQDMVILNNGNVGIGTTAPNSLLEVKGLSEVFANVIVNNDGGIPNAMKVSFQSNNLNMASLRGRTNDNINGELEFYTNNSGTLRRQVTILSNGNLGIGIPVPSEKLHVAGSVRIEDGTQATGKVLTSDAAGKASWQFGGVPAGAIMAFDLATCPTGWAAADGTAGTPDLRGEFVRGLDNGRGVDVGRTLGSIQTEALSSHSHSVDPPVTNTSLSGSHSHTLNQLQFSAVDGVNPSDNVRSGGDNNARYTNNVAGAVISTSGNHTHSVDIPAFNSAVSGGTETRPRNVALLYCKKQ